MNQDEQTNIRLPKDLKEWLRASAAEARRTLTSEVIYRLERSRQLDQQSQQKEQQP